MQPEGCCSYFLPEIFLLRSACAARERKAFTNEKAQALSCGNNAGKIVCERLRSQLP